MKLHSKNEYAEIWIGTQKKPYVVHGPIVLDSRASLARELLMATLQGGPVSMEIVRSICDMSAAMHDEWKARGWSIQAPPMDAEPDDNPVGFERGK